MLDVFLTIYPSRALLSRLIGVVCATVPTYQQQLRKMELTSSKLRLASSVSSQETIFKSSSRCGTCGKRHVILLVVFLGLIAVAAGGFLIGYFVTGNKAKANRECAGGETNRTGNQSETEKLTVGEVFSKFEEEVETDQLRENLRQAVLFTLSKKCISNLRTKTSNLFTKAPN